MHYTKMNYEKHIKTLGISCIFILGFTMLMVYNFVLQSQNHKEVAQMTVVYKCRKIETVKADAYIKERGNTTWLYEEKTFSVIFNLPESILEMAHSSKCVLWANVIDYSRVRNAIVFDTARKVGLDDISEYAFVDLCLNGE